MRRDRRGRKGRGSFVLILLGLLPVPATAQGGGAGREDPASLADRAERSKDPRERALLARKLLKTLALEGKDLPLLEARAWLLLEDPLPASRALDRYLRRAEAPFPPAVLPLFRRTGELLLKKGLGRAAGELLGAFVKKSPSPPPWAFGNLVRAWAAGGLGGKEEEMVRAGLLALEGGFRDWGFVQAFYRLLVHVDRGGRPEWAVKGFRVLHRIFPRQAWSALSLAVALRHTGRYQEAAMVLHEAARLLPGDPALPTDEGLSWKCLGRMDLARKCFLRGIAAAPPSKTRDPRISLGLLLLDRGKRKEAARVMAPTLRLAPPQPYAWLLWVRSAFCCGRRGF